MTTPKKFNYIGAGALGIAAITFGSVGIAGAQDVEEPAVDAPAAEESVEKSDYSSRREARQARRQARVESAVEDLIADGTITQEQVDAAESVREALQTQREEAKAEKKAALAEVLGLSVEELEDAKSEGATVAELAGDNLPAVVDLFVEQATNRIDAAVESGSITQEQADERLDGLEDRITTRLEDGGGFGKRGFKKGYRGHGALDTESDEVSFSA